MMEFKKTNNGFGFGTLKNLRRDPGFPHALLGAEIGCWKVGWKSHRCRRAQYLWRRCVCSTRRSWLCPRTDPHANRGNWVLNSGQVGYGLGFDGWTRLGLLGQAFGPGLKDWVWARVSGLGMGQWVSGLGRMIGWIWA